MNPVKENLPRFVSVLELERSGAHDPGGYSNWRAPSFSAVSILLNIRSEIGWREEGSKCGGPSSRGRKRRSRDNSLVPQLRRQCSMMAAVDFPVLTGIYAIKVVHNEGDDRRVCRQKEQTASKRINGRILICRHPCPANFWGSIRLKVC